MAPGWRTREEQGSRTLREELASHTVDDLKKLVRLFVSKAPSHCKTELVDFLVTQLDGDRLERYYERLDDLSKKAVIEAVHDPGGRLHAAQFKARYGIPPPHHRERESYDVFSRRPKPDPPAHPLRMLLFGGVSAPEFLPDDLHDRLRRIVPEPQEPTLPIAQELPAHAPLGEQDGRADAAANDGRLLMKEDTALAALHDVRAMLALADLGEVGVGAKTGLVSLSGAKAILPALRNGDFLIKDVRQLTDARETIRPFAWPLLLQAGKLAEISGSKLRLTRAGRKAMSKPPHETIRALWQNWLKSTLLDEFRRVTEVKGQTRQGALTNVVGRRQQIIAGLRSARSGQWISVDDFDRYLVATGRPFAVARDEWQLYIADPQYGSLGYKGYAGWLSRWYLMVFLFEYAATLGLIDVAYTAPEESTHDWAGQWGTDDLARLCVHEGLYYFRINALGAWLLGITREFIPPRDEVRPVLRVHPDLEVSALDGITPADRLFLDRIAIPEPRRGWSLSLPRLLEAVEQGLPLAQIRGFLEAKCAPPGLPAQAIAMLEQARECVGRITDRGPARVYACEDPDLARRLATDGQLCRLCHLAGDRLLVVPAAHDAAFRAELRELGYVAPPPSAE